MEKEVIYNTMFFSNFRYFECWFIDGNYFSKQLFGTLEVAQSKAKTLRNCIGCFDCTDCQNCIGCQNCRECQNCNYCNFCSFSDSLRYCNGCSYCQNCEFCNNRNYCKDCSFIAALSNILLNYVSNNILKIL